MCKRRFPAMENGLYIQYEAAWPVTLVLPDVWLDGRGASIGGLHLCDRAPIP
jgi:hypothetical protein